MVKKKNIRIVIALAVGFVLAMICMSIAIYSGYTQAYRTDVSTLTVRILGIPIYQLTQTGAKYTGSSMGPYMGAVCGIFMILSVCVEETIRNMHRRK
ncbi:MAG: LlsX family protein [Lactimicrobium sp.]|jgi:uncharacterized protein YhhL (DUF1145 family)|uniref:DUF5963 family protein n=1 Tax=Lactimicrobium sp. TaxID=2563780 RepID=UPI002F3611F6